MYEGYNQLAAQQKTAKRPARFTKMAVGMESSDDEFGILAAEPCLDKGVFQNGYLMHELAFACNDISPLPHVSFTLLKQSEWCALRTVARCNLALLPDAPALRSC